jgi:hypothetical protein
MTVGEPAGIRLRPDPRRAPVAIVCRYVPAVYELSAWPGGSPPAGAHRASIDTLTLSFVPNDHVWIGLDAYTNAERWAQEALVLPRIDLSAALICEERFDENGIGPSYAGPVDYRHAQGRSLLRLNVRAAPAATHVRFATGAVAGLDDAGALTDIWLELT